MNATRPIVNLYEERDTRITEVMDGPWRDVSITELVAGERLELASQQEEHAAFVIEGNCSVITADGTWELTKNGAFALPLSGHAEIVAGPTGLQILVITLNVVVGGDANG